jgi:uncharacterized repeat protein (TIGR04076 family)
MEKMYQVNIKVLSQKGTCVAGHKVGDEFECIGLTPGGMCISAFDSMSSFLNTLMFGGQFFWSQDKDAVEVACPDANNPVVFELRRIRPDK